MKLLKKCLSIIFVLLMTVTTFTATGTVSVEAAAKTPVFTVNSVTNLSYNDAKISAHITNPNKTKITRVGFQLGTASNKLTTIKYDSFNKATNYVDASFLMSKYKVSLKANTTYYYRFYIITGGKTYYSAVKNFKTKSDLPTISYGDVSLLTHNDATINGTLSNPKNLKIGKIGFQLGTASNKLNTNKYYNYNKAVKSKAISFSMSSNKITLKENTTYYYRIYVTSGSKTYYGAVKSFKTPQKSTAIQFPLSTDQVWYASTYEGHGGKNASAYSSVDITLKNGKSAKGYAVYAVEDGVVVSDDDYLVSKKEKPNGQIIIKHTKTLTTTNGKKYTTWYSMYAHMSNITVKAGTKVKRGQQIGKVSDVGNATGPHLHFTISSALNGTSWYQTTNKQKAISPYYVYGFVNQDGTNTKYCVCDRQGPGVTNQLIKWKPTGK